MQISTLLFLHYSPCSTDRIAFVSIQPVPLEHMSQQSSFCKYYFLWRGRLRQLQPWYTYIGSSRTIEAKNRRTAARNLGFD